MLPCIRYFDNAVLSYFESIKIDDGSKVRTPQIALAIPSRQGLDIKLNNEKYPVLPLIVVTRTNITSLPETGLVTRHVIRPMMFSLNSNLLAYDGVELMYVNYNYQIDYFAITEEMFNSIHQQLLFKLRKTKYVPVKIEENNHYIIHNGAIIDINFNDNTTRSQIPDNELRVFHATITFAVNGFITNSEFATRSVLKIQRDFNTYDDVLSSVIVADPNDIIKH